ncbi:MAG: hypothetical protein A2Z96_06030 [Spirochaetes bacterium GWB1_48_6]|nr:MAG: hypothetical protein A2Z96_06030 [Spirochaetes bacterium GWB1_48_6]
MNFWTALPRPFTALAPMEDVTDTVFRRLVADVGAPDVFFTEFIRARELFHTRNKYAKQRIRFDPGELKTPLVAQIWGIEPDMFLKAAALIKDMGYSGVDINMGCPEQKITKGGACSALINTPSLARELILAAREGAGTLPVSVKTRLGFKKKITEEWVGFLLSQELPALTLHGRIAAQMSEGPAEWDEIALGVNLRDQMGKPTIILGNGDLFSTQDLILKQKSSGVEGLMVGRGIFKDPYIFRKDEPHRSFLEAPAVEKISLMAKHVKLHQEVWGDAKGYDILKKFFKIYTLGFEGDLELRDKLMQTHSHGESLSLLREWKC